MPDSDRRTVTVELNSELHERLCQAAEQEGLDVPSFCRNAISRELNKAAEANDEGEGKPFDFDSFFAFRDQLLGDRVFPGDSVDDIREAREIRADQIDSL